MLPATRVAVAQVGADVTKPPTTTELISAIRAAAAQGALLVVLPELATSGYCFHNRTESWAAAESIEGTSVAALRRASDEYSIVVVFGIALRDGDHLFNAAVVVDGGHVIGVYRKSHLWAREKLIFTPGDAPPLIVATRAGTLAVMLCYDIEFPELVQAAAVAGAEIIAAPVNWPVIEHPHDQPAIEIVKAQAAAAYYGMFVLVADRCGHERGTDWVGGSCIVAPTGYLLAGPATLPGETAQTSLLWADIRPADSADKSLGPYNDRMLDRRETLYGRPDAPASG